MDPEEAQTIYIELSHRYSAWISAALGYIRTSLSAGAANNTATEQIELEQAIPSTQKQEQELKLEYREYKAYAQQRVYDAYGSIVSQIAEVLAQHDPLSRLRPSDDPAYTHLEEEDRANVLDEYSEIAMWLALRLPMATTHKDIERNFREMYGKRLNLTGRRNRSRRMAIARSVWEVWQSVRDGVRQDHPSPS